MLEFKVTISDSNFPTVKMSYYITAETQVDVDTYFAEQYSSSPNFSTISEVTDIVPSTPFFIPVGETFSTSSYKQSIASLPIDSEGVIDVSNGVLVFI